MYCFISPTTGTIQTCAHVWMRSNEPPKTGQGAETTSLATRYQERPSTPTPDAPYTTSIAINSLKRVPQKAPTTPRPNPPSHALPPPPQTIGLTPCAPSPNKTSATRLELIGTEPPPSDEICATQASPPPGQRPSSTSSIHARRGRCLRVFFIFG